MVSTGVMSSILKASGSKVGDFTLESSGSNIVGDSIFFSHLVLKLVALFESSGSIIIYSTFRASGSTVGYSVIWVIVF